VGLLREGDYIFFYGKGNENPQLGTEPFVHHRIVSAVKTIKSVSDRMSYIILRGCWCNIVLKVRRKAMIQKTVFMRNQNRFLIIFLSTI